MSVAFVLVQALKIFFYCLKLMVQLMFLMTVGLNLGYGGSYVLATLHVAAQAQWVTDVWERVFGCPSFSCSWIDNGCFPLF